jgi:hypothetical protein
MSAKSFGSSSVAPRQDTEPVAASAAANLDVSQEIEEEFEIYGDGNAAGVVDALLAAAAVEDAGARQDTVDEHGFEVGEYPRLLPLDASAAAVAPGIASGNTVGPKRARFSFPDAAAAAAPDLAVSREVEDEIPAGPPSLGSDHDDEPDVDDEIRDQLAAMAMSSSAAAAAPVEHGLHVAAAQTFNAIMQNISQQTVPTQSAFHDTVSKLEIVASEQLLTRKADHADYDSFMASDANCPHVVFMCVTRGEWPPETGQWKHHTYAQYPRHITDPNVPISRVTLSLLDHLPLHTDRYELFFVMANPPPNSHTLQVHIAVVDKDDAAAQATRAYFNDRGLLLEKRNNALFWYDDQKGMWMHPQKLDDKIVYLNICIAANVPVPKSNVWTTVYKQAKQTFQSPPKRQSFGQARQFHSAGAGGSGAVRDGDQAECPKCQKIVSAKKNWESKEWYLACYNKSQHPDGKPVYDRDLRRI